MGPLSQPEGHSQKIRMLPVQWISTSDGVVLVRGCTEVRIAGERAAAAAQVVLGAAAGEGVTREELRELFAAPDRPAIDTLVEQLLARNILVAGDGLPAPNRPETNQEIFYWHFGQTPELVTGRLNAKRIVIIGVNYISRQLLTSLAASGVTEVPVIDYEVLRNIHFFDEQGALLEHQWPASLKRPLSYAEWAEGLDPQGLDCLVATSDFGGLHFMGPWNEFCVTHKRPFLPVVLDRMVGYLGPLVIPGETACYQCLRAREDSCTMDPVNHRITEPMAYHRQAVVGFHPAMAAVLGEMANLELTRIFGDAMVARAGRLVRVDLLGSEMTSRRVLKIPRCPVCSPIMRHSSVNPDKTSFFPGNVGTDRGVQEAS